MELRAQRIFRLVVGSVTLALVVWGLVSILNVLSHGSDSNRFRVHVLFKDVQGLQVGSRVVHRGMVIGEIALLEFDAQSGRVRALVTLEDNAKSLVRTTSQFWIVRPRFTGLARSVSGLDTLIKESYVRLRVPDNGQQLSAGEELLGLERPPEDLAEDDLDDPMVGDLLATLVLPSSHGLRPGSGVTFRGQDVGEVRSVRLSNDGNGVLVRFRIVRAMRANARDDSRFWVARPILQGNLLTGMTVSSLGSLLRTGIEFDSPRGPSSEPLADGAVVVGRRTPPTRASTWDGRHVAHGAAAAVAGDRATRPSLLSPWVAVRYRAIEKDTFSANDVITASGAGVLFVNARNELYVITARSACDGSFLVEGHWYDRVRIADERIRVVLDDGRVWPVRRVWVDGDNRDIAVLRVQTPANAPPPPLPPPSSYLDFSREKVLSKTQPGKEPPFLLRDDQHAFGVLGHAKFKPSERTAISLHAVPQHLRPRP